MPNETIFHNYSDWICLSDGWCLRFSRLSHRANDINILSSVRTFISHQWKAYSVRSFKSRCSVEIYWKLRLCSESEKKKKWSALLDLRFWRWLPQSQPCLCIATEWCSISRITTTRIALSWCNTPVSRLRLTDATDPPPVSLPTFLEKKSLLELILNVWRWWHRWSSLVLTLFILNRSRTRRRRGWLANPRRRCSIGGWSISSARQKRRWPKRRRGRGRADIRGESASGSRRSRRRPRDTGSCVCPQQEQEDASPARRRSWRRRGRRRFASSHKKPCARRSDLLPSDLRKHQRRGNRHRKQLQYRKRWDRPSISIKNHFIFYLFFFFPWGGSASSRATAYGSPAKPKRRGSQ